MTRFVVDASVALKWYLPERDTEKAIKLVNDKTVLLAPSLLWMELGNGIWKNVRLGHADAAVWPPVAANLPLTVDIVESTAKLTTLAFEIAVVAGHPIYDCIYLALAHEADARVVTVDKRFLSAFSGTRFAKSVVSLDVAVGKIA